MCIQYGLCVDTVRTTAPGSVSTETGRHDIILIIVERIVL